jgi:hypothetical protein
MFARIATAAFLLTVAHLHAGTTFYGFECITNNNAGQCANFDNQLYFGVTDMQNGTIRFEFYNSNAGSPIGSSITDIYFDDAVPRVLSNTFTILNFPGVSYDNPASPGNLPGGGDISPAFTATDNLSADSDSPVAANGINPGEKLYIVFELAMGVDYDHVITALNLGGANGLRVGIHVQSIAPLGGSDSLINFPQPFDEPPGEVPEPAAMATLGVGLLGIGIAARKRRT